MQTAEEKNQLKQKRSKYFVNLLALYKAKTGIRQKELAKQIGVTPVTITNWLRGYAILSDENAKAITEFIVRVGMVTKTAIDEHMKYLDEGVQMPIVMTRSDDTMNYAEGSEKLVPCYNDFEFARIATMNSLSLRNAIDTLLSNGVYLSGMNQTGDLVVSNHGNIKGCSVSLCQYVIVRPDARINVGNYAIVITRSSEVFLCKVTSDNTLTVCSHTALLTETEEKVKLDDLKYSMRVISLVLSL